MRPQLLFLGLTLTIISIHDAFGQGVGIGTTSFTPATDAVLELRSTSSGFLMPRMTEAQRLAIPAPSNGLLIFQTDGVSAFYFYSGGIWKTFGGDDLGSHNASSKLVMNDNIIANNPGGEGIRITNSGNVGIGPIVGSPAARLHVSSGDLLLGASGGSASGIQFQNPGGTFKSTFKAGAQTADLSYTLPTVAPDDDQVLSTDAVGNLSWRDPSSGWKLTGNASTNPAVNYLGTTDAQPMRIGTSGTERIRVNATATEVGIGMTAGANNTLDITNATTGGRGVNVTANSLTTGSGMVVSANALTSGNGLSVTSSSASLSGTLGQFTASGSTTGTVLGVTGNALTTGRGLDVTANALTSGNGLSVTSSSASLSGTLGQFTASGSTTGTVLGVTGNALTTGRGLDVTANALTTGSALTLASSSTAFTSSNGLVNVTLSGNNAANTGTVMKVVNSGTNNSGATLMLTNAGTNASASLRVNDDGTDTDSSPFLIDGTGNVGIGNATPTQKLHVTDGNVRIANTSGTAGELQFQGTGAGVTAFKAGAQGASNFTYRLPITAPNYPDQALINDGSGNLRWGSPRNGLDLRGATTNYEDFIFDCYCGSGSNDNQYSFTKYGTASTNDPDGTIAAHNIATAVSPGENFMGVHIIRSTAVAASGGGIGGFDFVNKLHVGGYTLIYETRLLVSDLSTAAQDFEVFGGLGDFGTASPLTANHANNGIYFYYTHGTNGGKWTGVTANGGTRSFTDLNVAVEAGKWYKLKFVVASDGGQVDFYVDDDYISTLPVSVTTNIPNSSNPMKPIFKLERNVGTTARAFLIDYMVLQMDR